MTVKDRVWQQAARRERERLTAEVALIREELATVLKDIQDRLEAVENELVKEKAKTRSLETQISRWNQWWWAIPSHVRNQLPSPFLDD